MKFLCEYIRKTLFTVAVGVCLASLPASAVPLSPSFIIGTIDVGVDIPDEPYIIIHSPGGRIDIAFSIGPKLQDKTCIFKIVASAALEILLPYCKERYYLPSSAVMFHSAHALIPGNTMLSQWNAEELARDLSAENDRIVFHMMKHGFPLSELWLRKQLKDASFISGKGLLHLHPWIQPVEQCLHCPEWIRMLQ